MNNDVLRKLQLTQVLILKEVKRVCNKLGIQYFLTDGTLLGAIRHKGFIPWDDDLDIAMLRPEYEKFIHLAPNELREDYFLQNWHSDPAYPFPYSKLLMNDTRLTEAITQGTNIRNGIFIDIFPIDYCGTRTQMRLKIIPYMIWTKTLLMKSRYRVWDATGAKNRKFKYLPFILLSKFYSKKSLIRNVKAISNSWNMEYRNSGYCFENAGYNFLEWIMERKNIENFIDIQFENELFCAPKNSDEYLRAIYGDYMQLPPVEERENRHAISELKFKC